MRFFLLFAFLLCMKDASSQVITHQDTIYLFDFARIHSSEKMYTGTAVVFFSETDSLELKADRKRKMLDNVEPYFQGVQIIIPSNQSPRTLRIRVWEKYKGEQVYCDTLLTLRKTTKQPTCYYFYIENRGFFLRPNPCLSLNVVNTDEMKRPTYKALLAEFERFYLWQYDFTTNKLMKYLPY